MNLAVFELSPCLYVKKQYKMKEFKETSKKGANTRRQTKPYMSSRMFVGAGKFKMLVTSWNFRVQKRDKA